MDLYAIAPIDALRVLCGIWFVPHAISKLRNVGPASGTFAKVGFNPPRVFLYFTVALEVLACIGMVFNIYPRIAAACALVVLGGAGYAVVQMNGFNWRWQKQGTEFILFWAICCVIAVW